jgi:hypothetical protein
VAESGAKAQLGASLNVPPELIGHRSESRRKALHHCARLDKASVSATNLRIERRPFACKFGCG